MWRNSKTRTGRYIVTFDGAIDGNLIQIAMLVTEDAQGKVESIRAFTRPWPVVKLFREYMERNLRPDPVPDGSGNYRCPRHDNKRLTNSAQLMEPDACP